MGAYIVSIAGYNLKVRAGKGIRKYATDTHIQLDELALYKAVITIREALSAVVVKAVAQYAAYRSEQLKREIADYPPHTIFCECKGCIPREWIFSKSRRAKKGM
jgi:hypothetical protein